MIKPPFPYFGGKMRSVEKIWQKLGTDINIYYEPFMGSAAVALGAPTGMKLILNDINGHLVNFYRAVAADAAGVAAIAFSIPRCEVQMHAIHKYLVNKCEDQLTKLKHDIKYYDVEMAGMWIYGINMWIGDKWCYTPSDKKPMWKNSGVFQNETLYSLWDGLKPRRDDSGVFNKDKLYSLKDGLKPRNRDAGVFNQKMCENLDIDAAVKNVTTVLKKISTVLLHGRILNGDWKRVFTKSEYEGAKMNGVFLDPPYDDTNNYIIKNEENFNQNVRNWCIEFGKLQNFRIVISGYENQNDDLLNYGWKKELLIAKQAGMKKIKSSAKKEYLWTSPNCL